MMLRNRNLNVQQQNGAAGAEKSKRKQGGGATTAVKATKRQAPQLVAIKQEIKEEPVAKRSKARSSAHLPDFSKALCIDSSKKATSDHQIATANNNQTAVFLGTRSRNNPKLQQPALKVKEERPIDEPTAEQLGPAAPIFFQFDREQANELTAVAEYAQDIFTYYKHRERFFTVGDYFHRHPKFTPFNRAQLVNWMVDLQENFELNHETLYLGVKLFDLFMDRTERTMERSELQLYASAALLVSAKFDELAPPLIDDFIYLSDDAFTPEQMRAAERELLACVGYDLGAPLSYRFLRRFTRVCKDPIETLTLARYILESSLLCLRFCRQSESLMAAAALLLARRMRGVANAWNPLLQSCSGLALVDVEPIQQALNRMLLQRATKFAGLDVIYRKYSHEIFHKVAAIKPLPLDNCGNLNDGIQQRQKPFVKQEQLSN